MYLLYIFVYKNHINFSHKNTKLYEFRIINIRTKHVFNRPGVAGAVQQSPPSLID